MNVPSLDRFHFLRAGALAIAIIAITLAPAAMATNNLLANPSFDTPGGDGWSVAPGWLTDPFIPTGQVSLSRGGFTGTLLWQTLDIPNPGGAQGMVSVHLFKNSGFDGINTIALYLDYINSNGIDDRLLLLNPANETVLAPDGTLFEASFTVPAGAQSITGFSIDKTNNGSFYATAFSLSLQMAPPEAVPGVIITSPTDGATYASGAPIPLNALVWSNGASITGVEFFDNGTLIGSGKQSIYGPWSYADGSSIGVQPREDGSLMVDYSPPYPEGMYMFNGSMTSETPRQYSGTLSRWIGETLEEGPGGVNFTFGSNCTLDTTIMGMVLVGYRSLTGGVQDEPHFDLTWSGASPGPHSLTAKVYYGTGQFATSMPVGVMITGASGFSNWAANTPDLPEGRKGLMDHNGPMDMPNLTAYAMGLNPMTAISTDLPQVTSINQAAGTLHFIYRRARTLTDAMLIIRFSSDLKTWTNANVSSQSIIGVGTDWDLMDATITFTPGVPAFIKLAAQTMP